MRWSGLGREKGTDCFSMSTRGSQPPQPLWVLPGGSLANGLYCPGRFIMPYNPDVRLREIVFWSIRCEWEHRGGNETEQTRGQKENKWGLHSFGNLFASSGWPCLNSASSLVYTAITKHPRLSDLSKYIYFSQFWRLWSPTLRHQRIWCLMMYNAWLLKVIF